MQQLLVPARRPARSRPSLRALLVVAVLAAGGCEGAVSSVAGVAGRYNLTHINGTAIGTGYTIEGADPAIVIQSGRIELAGTRSGSYSVSVSGTRGGAAQAIVADAGAFVESNGTITFTSGVLPAPNNVYAGTISGGTLTLPISGAAFGVAQSVAFTLARE